MKRMYTIIAMVLCMLNASACFEKPLEPQPVNDSRVLQFSGKDYPVPFEGGKVEITLDVNFEYKVEITGSWLALDEEQPDPSKKICLTAQRNDAADPRSATIKVADRTDRFYVKSATISQSPNPKQKKALYIVDKNATERTKALFGNLWDIASKGFMFGHHDDLWYGRYWYNQPGESDTKAVCGDFPAVFSVDLAAIMDDRNGDAENQIRRRVILEASERGEVVIACAHLNNPQTGGDSWDNSKNDVVKNILTQGSNVRTKYLQWLDRLADFALNLKDSKGELVPLIFRPYHEHTQSWSWWGSSCTTESEFIEFWRFTVTYLRDTKGVHNLLYAVSPQMDASYQDARSRLLFRWPGDEYVDFIGMDCYHGLNLFAFSSNLAAIEAVAKEKGKPCGVTETGKESFTNSDYWTNYLLAPVSKQNVSLVVMWRNKYVGKNENDKHYYSVYPGHPSEEDFRTMYKDSRSIFSKDLPDMYTLPEQYEIK